MKKALIDPNAPVTCITAWVWNARQKAFTPVYTELPDSDRVAEVADSAFEVAPPLFWLDCADDVIADVWYYNTATQQILLVPSPPPLPPEPTT